MKARDRFFVISAWGLSLLVVGAFALLLGDIIRSGAAVITWEFLSREPSDGGRAGGIGTILVSTSLILVVCMIVALPLATATAVFLAEYARGRGLVARLVSISLDTLAAVPSIVYGLFGSAFFSQALGLGFSILSGGLTLACMVLPLTVRLTEVSLRALPDSYREAGAALGLSKRSLLRSVLFPAALPGVAAGFVLSLARALSETAALLFTSGYVTRMPESLLDSGRALSVHIFDLAMNVPGGERVAYGSTLVLATTLLIINFTALWTSRRWHEWLLRR